MNNNVLECLKTIASNFACLADELEKQQEENDQRMNCIEAETMQNRQALKDAANAILNKLS